MELFKVGAQVIGSAAACSLAAPFFGADRITGMVIGIFHGLTLNLHNSLFSKVNKVYPHHQKLGIPSWQTAGVSTISQILQVALLMRGIALPYERIAVIKGFGYIGTAIGIRLISSADDYILKESQK